MSSKAGRVSRRRSLDDFRDGRDEMNLVEFPFATLSERAGQCRVLEFQVEEYDRVLGKPVVRKLTVTGDAKFGLPTAKDEEVYLGLLQLTKLHGNFCEARIQFTRSELIRLMGWKNRDWSYHRIATALARLTGVRLFYENAWRDNAKKKHRTKGGFGLLDSFELRDGRARTADSDEEERLSEFRWNSVIFDSFQAGYLKKIDYAKIRKLSPAARRLYRYLDKHFYPPHRTSLVLNLKELTFEHIGMSRNYDASQLKRELAKPLSELEQMEFINADKHRFQRAGGRRGEWQITFTLRGFLLRSRTSGKGPEQGGRQATSKQAPLKKDQFDRYLAQMPESQRRDLEAEALRHSSAGFLRETVESQDCDGPLAAECRRQIVKAFLRNTTVKATKKVA